MTDEHNKPDSADIPSKPRRTRRSPSKKTSENLADPIETGNKIPSVGQERNISAGESPVAASRRSRGKKTAAGKSGAATETSTADAASVLEESTYTPQKDSEAQPKPSRSRSSRKPARKPAPTDSSPMEAAAAPLPEPEPQSPEIAAATMPAEETEIPRSQEQDAQESQGASLEESPAQPRKSRRGRRGGRGRRKKASVENAALPALLPAAPVLTTEPTETLETAPPAPGGKGRRKAAAPDAEETPSKSGRRKMFISVVPGEQVEVALAEDGSIHEYYLEMLRQAKMKGNIYKGIIHNVDANLQAAFVNYGTGKNGFLQIDEIHPEYYLSHHEAAKGKKFPPIQKVIKSGQEVLVQVVKEPTGNKGAFLTTWLSLAGRFLVLTPGQEQIGVSRKVENDEERARLRELMNGIEPGEGLGVIVRTVSAGTSKTTLKNDLQYLKRVWKEIRKKGTSETAPFLVYQEPGLAERAVRDYLTEDVCEVWVDSEEVAASLRETVSLLFPRKKDLVRVHDDPRHTLWERFNIQRQLEQIYSREVTLPSGGRLVFDQTEALMAVDINSGKTSGKGNFEAMALKTNLEAAEAIARHLKLRDIGGQVVIDFIEMRDKNHVREVEKTLRGAMKNDRARHDVGRMSSFGLLEIVRQRTGSSALAITMEPCPACGGTGLRRNMEWQALQALREIGRQARGGSGKCVFETTAELGMYLLNHKRDRLREMEQQMNLAIEIHIRP